MIRSVWWVVILLSSFVAALCCFSGRTGALAAEPAAGSETHVLYLRTEFLPYGLSVTSSRLGRELVRQAILIAARDELGLLTCDETLRESVPDDAQLIKLFPMERSDLKGKWNVKIFVHGATRPTYEKTYDVVRDVAWLYEDIVPKLEIDTRGEFIDALREAGFEGQRPALRDQQPPGPEIEALLAEVDFVAQYAAVRAAHHAIAAHGETSEWLGVLVRGYANLAMLTAHQWNSTTEVFTARSWLYAQRMVATTKDSDNAHRHRAYAWAMGGCPNQALADLEEIEKHRQPEGVAASERTSADKEPIWFTLIKPFCRCDRSAIKRMGEQIPAMKPWASRLWFQLAMYYQQPRLMYESFKEIKVLCPTAYGVYAHMAQRGEDLTLERLGGAWGPAMFNRYAPLCVRMVPGLPLPITLWLATKTPQARRGEGVRDNGDWPSGFSTVPMTLAAKLRQQSRVMMRPDPSWSVLAYLLEEEQFMQATNYLVDSMDATEHSLADDVDVVWPLVKNHRFAPYIDGMRSPQIWKHQIDPALARSIRFEDPHRNMNPMFKATWFNKDSQGNRIGMTQFLDKARPNYTLPSLFEHVRLLTRATGDAPPRQRAVYVQRLNAIAPHCDLGTRLDILWTEDPTREQLDQWATKIHDDPQAWSLLGKRYEFIGDTEAAISCYKKSLASVASTPATAWLAKIYLEKGDWSQWEKTLNDFLDNESIGLEQRDIEANFADGFILRGKWREAKPHAVAAAQSWSLVGLYLGSWACEGLAQWDESERWIRAAAQSYGTNGGYLWYFWCRRTGRGDVKLARQMAAQYMSAQRVPNQDSEMKAGTYLLLESNTRGALDAYRRALEFKHDSFSCSFMVAQLARQLGDEDLARATLDSIDKAGHDLLQSNNVERAAIASAGLAILELLRTGDASEKRLAEIDKRLGAVDVTDRSMFAYYVAEKLSRLGREEDAEIYWRRSLVSTRWDEARATLAGVELAKRHGTSRPDDDVLDETDLWPQPDPKKVDKP